MSRHDRDSRQAGNAERDAAVTEASLICSVKAKRATVRMMIGAVQAQKTRRLRRTLPVSILYGTIGVLSISLYIVMTYVILPLTFVTRFI